jgi:hypothetical protein
MEREIQGIALMKADYMETKTDDQKSLNSFLITVEGTGITAPCISESN